MRVLNDGNISLGDIEWGFDKSWIQPDVWCDICEECNMYREPDNVDGVWVWRGTGLEVYSNFNPLTGENSIGKSGGEVGYIGYVGVEGRFDVVSKFILFFKYYADSIEGDSEFSRNFI